MKKISQILLTLFVFTLILSCDSSDNGENEFTETPEDTTINAKWVVSNSSAYESFEFNESGNYIILKSSEADRTTEEPNILFGTYSLVDDETVVLSDFGTLFISDIDNSSINFSIALTSNPENLIQIEAAKQTEIEKSTNTDLLCQTWQLVSFNGNDVIGTSEELTVLFSRAGTYFVTNTSPLSDNSGGLAIWSWNNSAQTQIYYNWDQGDNTDGLAYITELTSNSLVIDEDGEISVLKPLSNTETTIVKPEDLVSKDILKKGFLKR
ncbi:hypothetical protein ACFFVB_13560 [Formosa undariae]|uniref:Lipocalin-like domain-containing protein n=1 Tax=Formosa undariae TaxID=1325436 RepID=A0ABV5F3W6_9FLAO